MTKGSPVQRWGSWVLGVCAHIIAGSPMRFQALPFNVDIPSPARRRASGGASEPATRLSAPRNGPQICFPGGFARCYGSPLAGSQLDSTSARRGPVVPPCARASALSEQRDRRASGPVSLAARPCACERVFMSQPFAAASQRGKERSLDPPLHHRPQPPPNRDPVGRRARDARCLGASRIRTDSDADRRHPSEPGRLRIANDDHRRRRDLADQLPESVRIQRLYPGFVGSRLERAHRQHRSAQRHAAGDGGQRCPVDR